MDHNRSNRHNYDHIGHSIPFILNMLDNSQTLIGISHTIITKIIQ